MNSKMKLALAAIVASGVPLAASAAGFYVGAGVGQGTYESSEFVDSFGGDEQFDDSDIALNIFAGYKVTDAVAVELGYYDLGDGKDQIFGGTAQVEPEAITLMAVGTAPLAENFAIFGKAGIAFLDIDTSFDGGEGGSGSISSQDLALGGGVQWNIGNFGVRGEALWIDAEDADSAMYYGVSGLWGFDF